MIDHEHDLELLRTATRRLLASAAKLTNAEVTEPSRLPGWSRGHVLAHLARNADALVEVLAGRPMYASAEQRDGDIERDAPRGVEEQLDDVRATHEAFLGAATGERDWSRTVVLRNGVTDTLARLPFRRLVEIELHHVDLDIGYDLEDLSEEFVHREIEFLTDRFRGHPDLPRLSVTDGTRAWTTGGTSDEPVPVIASAPDLLGWLAGRQDTGLRPELPPL